MGLRNTESGRKWLEQFPAEERIAAEVLLDAIMISTTDQIKSDIEAAIHEIISASDATFMVAPIVSMEDIREKLGLPRRSSYCPKMFDEYEPLAHMGIDAGSENYLALVARDVRKTYKGRVNFDGSLAHFEEAAMSDLQLRFIFIVDNSMSGTQVAAFLNSFWSSERISSLLDRQEKKVQVDLICWGATRSVIEVLDSAPEYLKVNRTIVCEVPTVSTAFPPGDALDAVMNIIQKYPKPARLTRAGKRGLGFMDTGALFLPLGASAPNNMPDLMIRNSRSYEALFPERRIPPDIKALTPDPSPLPLRDVDLFNDKLRKQKLKTASKISVNGQSKDWAMILLMALNYTPSQIRSELGLSYMESKRILAELEKIGWATGAFTLTESGNRNLREFGRRENYSEFRRGMRYVRTGFDVNSAAYYPTSVRGVR